MKHLNFLLFLVIIALFISGCSSRKDNNSPPTQEPEPSIGASPSTNSPTDIPTRLPSLTTTPAPTEPSITGSITPSSEYGQAALQLLNQMSLEEKVGQMFFVRYNRETALDDLEKYHLGGFILFSDAFSQQTKSGIKDALAGYQSASGIPLLIGVDEEGGTVNRVSKYTAFRKVPFKAPQELYQLGGFDLIVSDTIEKAKLLKSLGININLAPVCDVSTNSKDFINQRSFGQDAGATSEYVKTVVTTMNEQGIGCTLKHFPGYGNNIDTHTGIAIDERSSGQFYANDFLPFEAGIHAGAGSILVSHNIVKAFDEGYPASLSPKVHNILRNDLEFTGVIMTDDLSMDAIKKYTNNENAAVLAVLAGNDLLIASDYGIQIPAVIAAVEDKTLPPENIDAAVLRILEWKFSLGLMDQ
ncbi:MAG TPA: beta-hexosaminidase [Clostridiales bacterium]|nr:beta-hexosaminidase [Clostridiales bacterium]